MSIQHAILGMLSCKPQTGYDLKKEMQSSSFMHWSGNNNQIYRALIELHKDAFVTSEIQHRDSSPSKKIYTITHAGTAELKLWMRSAPEPPELKKTFLIQLAWADLLSKSELENLFLQYEQRLEGQIQMELAWAEKQQQAPAHTEKAAAIRRLLAENIIRSYKSELEWLCLARQTLSAFPQEEEQTDNHLVKEEKRMEYELIEKENLRYLRVIFNGQKIETEDHGFELLSLCIENRASALLIPGEMLSPEFLRLSTGVAGAVLQLFAKYNIRAAVLLDETHMEGRFKEFLLESNRGNAFRTFTEALESENWLFS